MSETNVSMSEWEWEGVMNTPERQEAAEKRAAEAADKRAAEAADKLEFLSGFHQQCAARRKNRIEITACRYSTGALAAGVAAYFAGTGGIGWLAWVLGGMAAVMGLIAAFGFGKACGMSCR